MAFLWAELQLLDYFFHWTYSRFHTENFGTVIGVSGRGKT